MTLIGKGLAKGLTKVPAAMKSDFDIQKKPLCTHLESGVSAEEKKAVTDIAAVLNERGSRYGSFSDNAYISQALCNIIRYEGRSGRVSRHQPVLKDFQMEALEMIAHKIARILSGDADYADNWVDIAGYAQLGNNPR